MLWIPLAFISCVEQSKIENTTFDNETKGVDISSVIYNIQWDKKGIEHHDSGGWTVQTDLGYKVYLRKGFLVTYAATLKRCTVNKDKGTLWFPDFLFSTAWAGHGLYQDPSAVHSTIVEDLSTLKTRFLGSASFPKASYCGTEMLLARSDAKTQNLPEDIDMLQYSLYLDLLWSKQDSKPIPLEVKIKLSHSGSAPFSTISAQGNSLSITQTRLSSGLFDQIDFKTEIPERAARQVLRNVIKDAVWSFTVE